MELKWLQAECHKDLREALYGECRTWLVTGAAGFIGSNIVEALLACGQKVRGLDNFATGKRSNLNDVRARVGFADWQAFDLIEGDVCDFSTCLQSVEGVDVVLHQAALGSVPRSIADPLNSFESNVAGFLNILEAVRLSGAPRLVYASSSSVYGDEEKLPKREEVIGKPLSPYAATKYIDEVISDVFQRSYSLGSVGLRYFNVFGRRQDPDGPYAAVIPKWVATMLSNGEVEIFGDGETSRDFCYIDNVIQANLRAALINFDGRHRVYNTAIGERSTLNELYRVIREGLDSRGQKFDRSPAYLDYRAGDVRHSQADVTKIAKEIGYVPQINMAEGIEQTLDWYVAQSFPVTPAGTADSVGSLERSS